MATNKLNNYQVFPREYFSGIDCYISFNNIPIDEIVSIECSVQEPIIPIYGYASYTYEAVAHGARIVNGSFTINFKEMNYIRSILAQLESEGISSISPKKVNDSFSHSELLTIIKGQRISDIEKIADGYAAKIWGEDKTDPIALPKSKTFFTKAGSNLSVYGFDIILSYGAELLEIGKSYGEKLPGSTKIINGVHITGVNQVVKPSGEPIYEQYMFIAKDLDNTI